ncbi:MAG: LTA synthase family protein [Bacteroidales bacterium]
MWNKFITSTLKAREYLLQSYLVLLSNFALLMLLFSIQRLLFYLFNRSFFPDISFAQLSYIFFGGLRFDLSALLWANIAYIVLYLIPFKFRFHTIYQSILKGFFLFINTIMLLLNSGDWVYFKYTLRRTTADVFQEFATEGNKAILLKQFMIDYWYVAVIWIVLSAVLIWLYRKSKKPSFQYALSSALFFYIGSVVLLVVTAALCIGGMRGSFINDRPISLINAGQYVNKPLEMTIVQNTPFCIFKTLGKKTLERVGFFENQEILEKSYNPLTASNPKQPFTPMNVIVIVWESLSREHVGALNKHLGNGAYLGFTPFLDTIVAQSLSFTHSYANGRKSIEGLPSVMTSVPTMQIPYVLSRFSGNKLNSLANLLKPKGYSTSFFHGSTANAMGFWGFSKSVGVDKFYGRDEYGNDEHFDGLWGLWDEEFLQFMAQQLKYEKEPFLSTVFTLTSHHPFKIPARYAEVFKEEEYGPVYKCMRYTDYALRRFFDEAKKQSWYDNTLFVITADHANNQIFPESQNSAERMAVPVIYFAPNGSLPRGIVDGITQQTDIMPTVLGLLNYDEPFIAFGQNALSNPKENFAVNFVNGIYQAFYRDYVLHFDGTKTIAVYNIVADKMLQNNIIGENMDMQTLIEQKTKGFIQQYNNRIIDNCMTVDCQKYNSHE